LNFPGNIPQFTSTLYPPSTTFNYPDNMVWRTLVITVATCFMLGTSISSMSKGLVADNPGTTFTHWIVDHNVLWTSPTTVEALERSIKYYSFLADAPDGMGWAYIAVGVAAIVSAGGQLTKVLNGGQSEVLFDGGSVGRYLIIDKDLA
jgi:hypothetical protein